MLIADAFSEMRATSDARLASFALTTFTAAETALIAEVCALTVCESEANCDVCPLTVCDNDASSERIADVACESEAISDRIAEVACDSDANSLRNCDADKLSAAETALMAFESWSSALMRFDVSAATAETRF